MPRMHPSKLSRLKSQVAGGGGDSEIGDIVFADAAPTAGHVALFPGPAPLITNTSVLRTKFRAFTVAQDADTNADTDATNRVNGYSEKLNGEVYYVSYVASGQANFCKKTTWNVNPTVLCTNIDGSGNYRDIWFLGFENGIAFAAGYSNATGGYNIFYASAPYSTWTKQTTVPSGASAAQIWDMLWTGSRYVVMTSNGIFQGATLTTNFVAATGTGISGSDWRQVFQVGSNLWARNFDGNWAKSTDGGVSFVLTSGITNAPYGGYVYTQKSHTHYIPELGMWIGIRQTNNPNLVYNVGDPTSAWTLLGGGVEPAGTNYAYGVDVIYLADMKAILLGFYDSFGLIHVDGKSSPYITSYAHLGDISAAFYSGAMHMLNNVLIRANAALQGQGGRWKKYNSPYDNMQLPTIAPIGKQLPYLKVV